MRSACLLATAILAFNLLAVDGQAQDPGPREWWTARVDGGAPTVPAKGAVSTGWNLRIPLLVDNDSPVPAMPGTPVQAYLDLGLAAVAAGWPSTTRNGLLQADGFTAVPRSVRIVEATVAWREVADPKPLVALVTPGWMDADQGQGPYAKRQDRPFDAASNAVVTVEWVLRNPIAAGSQGHYFAYYDIVENHDVPSQTLSAAEQGFLDGLYWVGSGMEFYAYHPGQATVDVPGQPRGTQTLLVVGQRPGTHVTVATYDGGLFPQEQAQFIVGAGEAHRHAIGPTATHVRVTSDAPVTVATHDRRLAAGGDFVPSSTGGLRGARFDVPGIAEQAIVLVAGDAPASEVCVTPAGGQASCRQMSPGDHQVIRLRPSETDPDPTLVTRIEARGTAANRVPGPLFVQLAPRDQAGAGQPGYLFQVPDGNGAPAGSSFRFSGLTGRSASVVLQAGETGSLARIIGENGRIGPDLPVPALGRAVVPGPDLPPGPEAGTSSGSRFYTDPLEVQALSGGLLQVMAGIEPPDRQVAQDTPFGGLHGQRFHVTGPFVIFPFYDLTSVTVTDDRGPTLLQGDAGTPLEFPGDPERRATLSSDKPVSVFPLGDPQRYARFLASKPGFLTATAEPGEYRGYLLDIRPVGAEEPVFLSGLPGQTLEVDFRVDNLARWSDGEPLPDQVHLSVSGAPAGWESAFTFADPDLDLPDAAPVFSSLRITFPSGQAAPLAAVEVVATSRGNGHMTASFALVASAGQRFGVDAWFGPLQAGGGPSSLPPTRIGLGEVRDFLFAVKNTGSGPDHVDLVPSPLSGGWQATLFEATPAGKAGAPAADRIGPLAAGTGRAFLLRIQAPSVDTTPVANLILDVNSVGSSGATDTLILPVRLALGQAVELDVPQAELTLRPGATQSVVASLRNVGQDGLSVLLGMSGTLPKGWVAEFAGTGNPAQGPVAVLPGQSIDIPLRITAAPDAEAGRLVTLLLRADGTGTANARDAVSVLVRAERIHDLLVETPGPPTTVLPGKQAQVRFNLQNLGNGIESVRVVPTLAPAGWAFERVPETTIMPGTSRELAVNVTVPAGSAFGPARLRILFASTQGAGQTVEAEVVVGATGGLLMQELTAPERLRPGDAFEVAYNVTNAGNQPQALAFGADAPSGWPASVFPASLTLAPGASATIVLSSQVPLVTTEGSMDLALTASSMAGAAAQAVTALLVEVPRLSLVDVRTEALGESVAMATFAFHNAANVSLPGLRVAVYEEGRLVSTLSFRSIGANATVEGTLRWAVQDRDGSLEMRWESAAGPGESGSTVLTVPGLDRKETPALGASVVLLGLAMALTRRRLARS